MQREGWFDGDPRELAMNYDCRIPASSCRPVLLLTCSPSSPRGSSGGGKSMTFFGRKRWSPAWYGFLSSTYLRSRQY